MGRVKLTDKQKKKIIADYVQCQNYSEVARKYRISKTTVKNITQADSTTSEKLRQKKEENTQDTLAYMESQHEKKKKIIDLSLDALISKLSKPDVFTNIKDIIIVYGTLIDKELKLAEIRANKEQQDNATVNMIEKLLSEVKNKADNDDGI